MLGVIEMRHEPNSPGAVRVEGRVLSSWLPWHFDHCYNDELNRAGVLRAIEVPPEGGLTGFVDGIALYDAISPEVRDQIEGADRDLRDGRDHGEPPVRSARRFRRRRAEPGRRRRDDGVRGPAPRAPPRGLDAVAQARRSCTSPGGWRRASRAAKTPTATHSSPPCATRSSRRRRTSATSISGSRPTCSSGTTGACCTRCRECRPNTREACTARPSPVTTASADSKRPNPPRS